ESMMLRRSFLSRFSAATAAFGLQPPQPSSTSRPRAWEAAHHEQDEWLADNAAKHRVIFDTWNAERFPDAVQVAGNIFETNQTDAKPEDVRKELTSNTLGPSHFVPAGVVAVTRAQERGYANISIG